MGTTVRTIGSGTGAAGTGTVTATNASTTVVGSSTLFTTEFTAPGTIAITGVLYNIASITNDLALVLASNYLGSTGAGKAITKGLRQYTIPQVWEDASPANLVTDGNIWQGQMYNDSEFTSAAGTDYLTMSGTTTDATHYKELTTAAGQSFQDHASVRTNGLRYNVSNGVGINLSAAYPGVIVKGTEDYGRVSKIQFTYSANGLGGTILSAPSNVGWVWKDLLVQGGTSAGGADGFLLETNDALILNCLIIKKNASTTNHAVVLWGTTSGATKVIGCTIVRCSEFTAGGTGILAVYNGVHVVQSTAVFGFTSPVNNTANFDGTASKFNATDKATSGLPGTNNNYSVTYSSVTPFVGADSSGTLDFKAVAATTLAGAGFLDATNAPNDISAYVRPSGPTIGTWQLTAVGRTTKNTRSFEFAMERGVNMWGDV